MARELFNTPGNSKVFAANYRGLCAACDDTIYPGDDVCYEDNELIHSECRAPVNLDVRSRGIHSVGDITRKPSKTPDEVCPICSLIHVGECL